MVIRPPAWSISTQAVFYMGRYGELVKPADCKSVTLVVNIAGSRSSFHFGRRRTDGLRSATVVA